MCVCVCVCVCAKTATYHQLDAIAQVSRQHAPHLGLGVAQGVVLANQAVLQLQRGLLPRLLRLRLVAQLLRQRYNEGGLWVCVWCVCV